MNDLRAQVVEAMAREMSACYEVAEDADWTGYATVAEYALDAALNILGERVNEGGYLSRGLLAVLRA